MYLYYNILWLRDNCYSTNIPPVHKICGPVGYPDFDIKTYGSQKVQRLFTEVTRWLAHKTVVNTTIIYK